jgi:hypothetical protein
LPDRSGAGRAAGDSATTGAARTAIIALIAPRGKMARMPEAPFIHLRLHSEYSITDGIVRLGDAVARAASATACRRWR